MVRLDEGGRARPWVRLHAPKGRLARYVESFSSQSVPRAARNRAWRIVPDTSPHILVARSSRTGGSSRTRVSLVGPRAVYVDSDQRQRRFLVAARLHPGAVRALLGVSARELLDRSVSLADALGAAGAELEARAADAEDADEAQSALESWSLGRAMSAEDLDQRIEAMWRQVRVRQGRSSVESLARDVGLSARRLRSVVGEAVGLTPKRMLRIARAHVLLQHHATAPADWSRLATRAGYHDESHMARDFGALFGETPRRFLRRGDGRFVQSDASPAR